MGETFKKIRRKIVVLKFTMVRGYMWCQVPTMSILAAGIIRPYFPWLQFYQLALLGIGIFMTVGYIDRRYGFLSTDQSYGTEQNKLMMKGLFGKNNNGPQEEENIKNPSAEELVEELKNVKR